MITLMDVVTAYLNEAEIPQNKVTRLLEIGKRGVKDIHMDVSGAPTTVKLDFNPDTLTSNLPPDYISYLRIGYEQSGVIVPFAENPRIKLYPDDGKCLPPNQNQNLVSINNLQNNIPNYPYWGYYGINRIAPNGLYGGYSNLGGSASFITDFRIDELNGFVQFGSNPNVDIFMEYLADSKLINGEFIIHPFDEPALLAWLAWRDIENKRGVSAGEKMSKKVDYYRERGESRKRHYSITLSTAYQKVRQASKSAPQF